MGRKKQRKLERKLEQEKQQQQKIVFPNSVKVERFKVYGLLLIVFSVFLGLSLWQINAPFIHVSEDTNGTNGVASANLARFGPFALKLGLYNRWISDISNRDLFGKFYTHHPIGFLLPTVVFYKLFGINETTTRLGPLFLMLIAVILFYLALYKIFKDSLMAFLCSLTFVILPGTIYYSKHLDMSPPSLAFMLISFSLFIFYCYETKRSSFHSKLWFYLFLLSVFIGGLTAWHYYLMPFSIFIFILFTKQGKSIFDRKKILILLPILILASIFINLWHIYLLNGSAAGLDSLKSAFFQRSARQISSAWFARIFSTSQLNFTLLFLITAALGFIFSLFKISTNKKPKKMFFGAANDAENDKSFSALIFLLPIVLMPFLILLIFQQWSTHPFGVIYFLPFIGVFSGILFYYLIKYLKVFGILAVSLIFIFGVGLSWKNLKFFYDKFLILGPKDALLLKEFKPQAKDNELCQGRNIFGLDFNGIVDWYSQKETTASPDCFSTSTPIVKTLKYGLIFNPGIGDFYKQEVALFEQNGFKNLIKCGDVLCLISR